MADKIINQLQLIAAVTGSLNIPCDNGVQSYRYTPSQMKTFILANEAILLNMLKVDIFTTLTAVTADPLDYFVNADASDSGKTKKSLISDLYADTIVSATTTHAAAVATYILCSSTSFSATLPTAVGNTGKKITFFHNGTSGTNKYTIGRTSSQTINGIAADYIIFRKNQFVTFMSDGANWIIKDSNRLLSFRGKKNGGSVTTSADIAWTVDEDFASMVSSNLVVVPANAAGNWVVMASMGTTSGTPAPRIMLNSATYITGPSTGGQMGTSAVVLCAAGDTLGLRTSSNLTLNSDDTSTTISIYKQGA